jgi:hypothetical protein
MSNLILSLQNGLVNSTIYGDIKNEEIINLIEEYNRNPNDFIDYKNYFNDKCINDYNVFLISNIINRIEKTFNKEKIHGDDGVLENKILFMFLRYKDNIKSFITKLKINEENLLNSLPQVKQLRQKIEIFNDLNKDVSGYQKQLDIYQKNIFDIIIEDIITYLDSDIISPLLNSFIKYIVKNNKKFINIKINHNQYNNNIIKKFTDSEYENLDDMINDLKSNKFIKNQELSYYITKYKISKNQSFKKLINEFNNDDIELDSEMIENYRNLNFESNFKNIKKHIFIEIMEICDQPFSQTYLDYLKNVYQRLDLDTLYESILEQNKVTNELIIEYENEENIFIKSIIKKIKKNDKNLNHFVLKKSINDNLNKSQFNDLKKEVDFFHKLINLDNKDAIITNFITYKNKNILSQLTEFNIMMNMNTIEKHLKNNPVDQDNIYIQSQMQLYNLEKSTKRNYIFISLHSLFKNDNIAVFFNFMKDLENKINFIDNPDLHMIFNESLNIFLSEIFNHYVKAINNYHSIDLHPSENQLFYNYKDNSKIRVYVNDPIEEILFKIKNNPNKNKYMFGKLLNHILDYKYYNVDLDIYETIIDKITHDIYFIRYINLISQINSKLDKPFYVQRIKKYYKIINENLPKVEIKAALRQIIDFNNKEKIISKKSMNFLIGNWKDLNFLTFKKIIDKRKITKKDKIDALKFIKLLTQNVDNTVAEKKINIYRKNHNRTEKKIIYDTANELKRIMSKGFKFQSSKFINNNIKNLDFFANYKVDISDIKGFEKNDMTYLEIRNFKNAYKDNNGESIYIKLINETIDRNSKFLSKQFQHDINFKILYNNLISDKNKIKIIAKKYHKHISYNNIFKKINSEKKTFSDIISIVSIIFCLDNLINQNNDFDMKSFDHKIDNSIVNKKIFIIKSGLISRIKSKIGEKYVSSNNIKLNRKDFILYDSIIDQDVQIIKGNYKGQIGRLIKTNDIKNLIHSSKENKKNQKQQIKHFDSMIVDLQNVLYNLRDSNNWGDIRDNLADDLELSELVQYRKDILNNNNNISVKYKFNIKINPTIRKVLNESEKSFIKKLRSDRIKNISFDIKNLQKQKKIFINDHKQQYIIRLNEGTKHSKNVFFISDQFKLNNIKLLDDELKKDFLIQYKNVRMTHKYTNLYDFIQYIFNYNNVSNNNVDPQYFINIYTEAIKIFNINKKNNMKKVDIKNKILSDLVKIEKNIKHYQKRIEKKSNYNDQYALKKQISIKNKRQNMLDSINIHIKKFNLQVFKTLKKNPFKNDLDINDKISFFKINSIDMKKDLQTIYKKKLEMKIINDKQDTIDNEKLKILFYDIKKNLDDQMWDLSFDYPEISIIEYLNNNFINNEQEDLDYDDEESIDFDDILDELDEIELDSEDERIDAEEKRLGRKLTWIELTEL